MDEKKVKEAIEELKSLLYIRKRTIEALPDSARKDSLYNNEITALETAIEALEKQLPKKPIDKSCVKDNDTIYGYVGICPSCNGIIDDSMIVCDCTQVLDWSE